MVEKDNPFIGDMTQALYFKRLMKEWLDKYMKQSHLPEKCNKEIKKTIEIQVDMALEVANLYREAFRDETF